MRFQLKVLSEFLHGFELTKLHPDLSCVHRSPGLIPYVLSDQNKAYAVYLRAVGTDHTTLSLHIVDGNFNLQILNTITGSYTDPVMIQSRDGILEIEIDIPDGELALKITRE